MNAIQFRFSVTLYKHTYLRCIKITIGNAKKERAGSGPALRDMPFADGSVLDGEPRRERGIRRVAQRLASKLWPRGAGGLSVQSRSAKQGLGQRLFLSRSNAAVYGPLVVANLSGAR